MQSDVKDLSRPDMQQRIRDVLVDHVAISEDETDVRFGVITAGYLLNYARSRDELNVMVSSIRALLRPHGRFITINDNVKDDPRLYSDGTKKYGWTKERGDKEGDVVTFRLWKDDDVLCEITNYWLSPETIQDVFDKHGFNVRWIEAQRPHVGTFWDDMIRNNAPFIVIEATLRD
jgi:hypothetical protein